VGEFITTRLSDEREAAGFGGYMVNYREGINLDCYNHLDICKASFANDPRNCINVTTNTAAVANAKLAIDFVRRKVKLVADSDIPPHIEILWDYGENYRFPDVQVSSVSQVET
jgi:hypothetical protein